MDEIVKMFDAKLDKHFEDQAIRNQEEARRHQEQTKKELHLFVRSFIKQIKESCENMNMNFLEKFARQDNYIV